MLKIVRTPSSLRTGAACFIAGWWFGANMKPMPVSSIALRDLLRASASMFAPSASSTSALPDLRRHRAAAVLRHARAGGRGDEHRRGRDVEGVRAVAAGADDVDQVACGRRTSTLVANSRITCAAAAISPMVSFLTRRPMMSAAIITGDTSPLMIWRMSVQHLVVEDLAVLDGALDRLGYRDLLHEPLPVSFPFRKFCSSAWPCSVRIDSGWNCTPSTARLAVAHAHDLAVLRLRASPRGTAGRLSRSIDERVIARRRERRRARRRRRPLPSWRMREVLPCMTRSARTTLPPNAWPIAWWPRHTPRIGTLPGEALAISRSEMPASSGVHGPGEMHDVRRRERRDFVDVICVVAEHPHLGARARRGTAPGCR